MVGHPPAPVSQIEEDIGENYPEDNKVLTEQERQQQLQQTYNEAAPEAGQLSFLFQLAGAAGLMFSSNRSEVMWAFDKLNDPNFEREMLKVMDPEKFHELKKAMRIADGEINRQRENKVKQGKDEAEVGVWKIKRKLGFDDFDRKKQAFGVAEAVQKRVDAAEIRIKLENASQMYGVELGTLQRDLAGWLKENPGEGIDEYVASHGGKLYREKTKQEGKEPDKDVDKKVAKTNESARAKARQENTKQIIRAQQQIKRDLTLAKGQTISPKDQILYVLHDGQAPAIQATIPPPPAPAVSPPPPSPIGPSIPVSTPKFSLPGFAFPAGLTQGLNNIFGGLGKGIGSVFGKNGVFSKAFDLANKVGKQLINRGLDAIAPGLGMAIGKINDVIKSILGIDVEGLILKGAVVVVGAVAAVVIILPIIIGGGVFSYVTGSNPMKLSYTNGKTIGWSEFNKQFLTINNDNYQLSWQRFEQGNLTPQKQYLSLEK